MNNHFQLEKIRKDIYKITEPYYREHANMFLFCGSKNNLLVDCGLGIFDIKKYLEKKGFSNPKATLTHCHFDHMGGIKFFSSEELIIPETVKKNITNSNLWGLEYFKASDFEIDYTKGFKIPPDEIVKNYSITIPKFSTYGKNYIDIGKFNFEIIPAPGHTDDSVIFFDKNNKLLVTGDVLYDGELYLNFPNSNKKYYLKTLELIEKLDYVLLLPGHNQTLNKEEALEIIKNIKVKKEKRLS